MIKTAGTTNTASITIKAITIDLISFCILLTYKLAFLWIAAGMLTTFERAKIHSTDVDNCIQCLPSNCTNLAHIIGWSRQPRQTFKGFTRQGATSAASSSKENITSNVSIRDIA